MGAPAVTSRRVMLLPEEVASQVAAGEVIERPASIVKELVENSLDAGARRIEVQTDRGGIALVKVTDDGCGMARDDALTALERHATSKIRSGSDLACVTTLGFRGEALPSIASVSRFVLRTREHHAVVGTEIRVAGGRIESVADSGEAPGTQVEVKSLFYNLPARRKFLRSEQTENGHIEHQLHTLALCHWRVAFTHVRDGKLVFRLPAASSVATRVADLFGRELLRELLVVDDTGDDGMTLKVTGLIGKPGTLRSSRASQFLFVNGRAVEARELLYGIRDGYGGALPRGRHPVLFLFIELPHGDVDVNVHPAKREVRFRRPLEVQNQLAAAIQEAIHRAVPAEVAERRGESVPARPARVTVSAVPVGQQTQDVLVPEPAAKERAVFRAPVVLPRQGELAGTLAGGQTSGTEWIPQTPANTGGAERASGVQPSHSSSAGVSAFQPCGELGDRYLLYEDDSGLVILDTLLARQRIHYEIILRQMSAEALHGQQLLMPPVIELPPREADWLRERLGVLARVGVVLEEFGLHAFKLDCLPSFLDTAEPEAALMSILEDLRHGDLPARSTQAGQHDLARALAARAAAQEPPVKLSEAQTLMERLLACDLPYCCPVGRPTMIHFAFSELARKFGR